MGSAMTRLVEFLDNARIFVLGSLATLLLLRLEGYEGLTNHIYWAMGVGALTLIAPELKRRSYKQKSATP